MYAWPEYYPTGSFGGNRGTGGLFISMICASYVLGRKQMTA